MSLFVDLSSISDTSTATQDLFSISFNDGNLTQGAHTTVKTNIGTINVAQVNYTSVTTGKASADRLFTLVNTSSGLSWAFPIVITPIDGSLHSTNPYTGDPIKGNGETSLDTAVTPNVIHVCYDTSQCAGAGIAGFDTGNNPIATPNCVILYHELSHAFHRAINQHPFPQTACPGDTTDEPAAEIDENVMRTELGLCQRDVCNHGGTCGAGNACGGSAFPGGPPLGGGATSTGSGGGGCFIVSAATGSSQSVEVVRLRKLRDRISAVSGLSAQLIDGVYLEYFQFSPGIAAEVEQDLFARMGMLRAVVRPLLAWYTLAGTLGLEFDDRDAVSRRAQDLLDACPRFLGIRIRPLLEAIRSGGPLPANAPQALLAFLPRIREAVRLPLASWAILDPLIRAWTLTTRHLDVLSEVAEWLAAAPLEKCAPPSDPELLDQEIATLAGFLGFQPTARFPMGMRLATAWPEASDSLKRHAFL
jgi:hypothetical protein